MEREETLDMADGFGKLLILLLY